MQAASLFTCCYAHVHCSRHHLAGIKSPDIVYAFHEVIFMTETTGEKRYTWRSLVALVVATLGAGAIVGFLTQQNADFYAGLNKPVFAPPGWLFPVAWTLLYAAMATAMWFVLQARGRDRFILLGLYVAQLAVNLMESAVNFLAPGRRRCPHLGCALKWNKQEHSWDCPCHGSRFGGRGELLHGPAQHPLGEE